MKNGAAGFKDIHESDPAKCYKMIFKGIEMAVSFSADGLHWSEVIDCPQINAHGDTLTWHSGPVMSRYPRTPRR
jgi:hypothetical protein